ncbi:hypothetical protein DERF_006155 [Dermatophagoides farinae]|uniref:Uncharacterized protein n=1 Tax=Dermatophagoides farinae TaxID=6954 RepID=A0A922I8D4_DERFA|nr:hypothetical protein DERF_006155 [Dermatophagoides farinae]
MNVNKTLKAEKEDEPSLDQQQQQEFQIVSIVKLGKQSKAKKKWSQLHDIVDNSEKFHPLAIFCDVLILSPKLNAIPCDLAPKNPQLPDNDFCGVKHFILVDLIK